MTSPNPGHLSKVPPPDQYIEGKLSTWIWGTHNHSVHNIPSRLFQTDVLLTCKIHSFHPDSAPPPPSYLVPGSPLKSRVSSKHHLSQVWVRLRVHPSWGKILLQLWTCETKQVICFGGYLDEMGIFCMWERHEFGEPGAECHGLRVRIPPKIIGWNLTLQCDGVRRQGLGKCSGLDEVLRVESSWWDSCPHKGQKRARLLCSALCPCEDASHQSPVWKRALTRTQPCWHPNLGLTASEVKK